jgi:very-short-patch-repair endonuclease
LRPAWCTREQLAAAAAEQAGLRGVVRLRALVPHASAKAESPMESRMRWRFIDGGLPAPEVQVRVIGDGRSHHLDTGWRDARVGAEFDGLEAHMSRQRLTADRDRHNWLTERRWTLLHSTATDVYRRPDRMVATAARALGIPDPRRSRGRGGDTPMGHGVSPLRLHDHWGDGDHRGERDGGGVGPVAGQTPVERHSRARSSAR